MIPADMIAALQYRRPEIAERIVQTWNDPLCVSYMTSLLLPDEWGEKEPFDQPTASALMGLIELHEGLYPRASEVWVLR
jgi:hypothetical protein